MTGAPKQSSHSWPSLLAGFLVGLAAGAVISLLYAPKSGKETREELMARADKLKERLDTATRELKADLTQAVEAGRTAAAERAAELRQQAGLE